MGFHNPHPRIVNVHVDGKVHHIFPGQTAKIADPDVIKKLARTIKAGDLVETDDEGTPLGGELKDIKKMGVKSSADEKGAAPTTVPELKAWLDEKGVEYPADAKKPGLVALYDQHSEQGAAGEQGEQ